MMASRPPCPLSCPDQDELNALVRAGVPITGIVTPVPMRIACGDKTHDGLFEPVPGGERWYAIEVADADDIVFWHRERRDVATWSGRAFALGEEIIDQAATYAFDNPLNVFADPLEWLRENRDGIMVLPGQWPLAFDRLRDAPRIAVAESLLPTYRRHMRPARMPELFVIPTNRQAA